MEMEEHESKRKTVDKKEEDYISLLPDCLLIDIISRLPETKEAIRTGTLSKRWQHLWPYVSNLVFIFYTSFSNWNDQRLYDIVSSIDQTLSQCRQFNIIKFKLRIPYAVIYESLVNDWIRYAFSCNVQDLDLYLDSQDDESEFVLDQFFFVNSSFTCLELDGCVFIPTGAISWTNLKSLQISQGDLDADLIRNMLSGSPLLEIFYLLRCYGFGRIDITSKSVKKFVLDGYFDPVEQQWPDLADIVEINAPHLLSLSIIQDLLLWKVVLLDVSSLVEAELDYEKSGHFETTSKEEKEEMLKGFLLSLRHVKRLEIGDYCFRTLTRLKAKGFTFPSNAKKYLECCGSDEEDSDSDSD
ncbi:F-box/LRR-repeat protein 25-like protein [Tanacetum coccineum]